MNNILKIINFGPIKGGFDQNNGYMPIGQLSIFSGTQGTGKSTVVKLYSTFVWLEKALVRGDFTAKYVEQYSRFQKKFLAYQGINNYIRKDTFLHYQGEACEFVYENGKFRAMMHPFSPQYVRPQVMYYPAERNLLSVIDKASGLKGIPGELSTLLEDYNMACRSLSQDLQLPINGVRFRYDKLNKVVSVIGSDYKVRMSEASSGIQSLSPLFVVMNYLSDVVRNGADSMGTKTSAEERSRIDKRINALLMDDSLDEEMRMMLIKRLSDNKNQRMISIVEEPEQNLFPESQESILYDMIRLSANGNDQLLFTTHSPYMLNYIMLAIKAKQVEKVVKEDNDIKELEDIVPIKARIEGKNVTVYQLTLDGTIKKLPTYEDMPSDENFLNQNMRKVNLKYSNLLEIQSLYE